MSQGASNSGGQGAGKSFVSFSRPAAQRIAKAVRLIEGGDRSQPGLTFDHPMPASVKMFRVGTFTGAWSKDSAKVVTFRGTLSTTVAHNIFVSITGTTATATTKNCAIAKDGTAWYVISAEC